MKKEARDKVTGLCRFLWKLLEMAGSIKGCVGFDVHYKSSRSESQCLLSAEFLSRYSTEIRKLFQQGGSNGNCSNSLSMT